MGWHKIEAAIEKRDASPVINDKDTFKQVRAATLISVDVCVYI
jgi:hypothetical protein